MLRFSSEQLIENAGTDNFDYIIVCWNTTQEVDDYISQLSARYKDSHPRLKIVRVDHKTIEGIGYVPNLRAMMNEGFSKAFELDEYGGLVNTDQAFYKNWLINLAKHCGSGVMVNSLPVVRKSHSQFFPQADFGITEYGLFDTDGFRKFCEKRIKPDETIVEEDLRGVNYDPVEMTGLPYLFPRMMWEKAGPWELNVLSGTPDVNFFRRAHNSGFKFMIALDSLSYHVEGAERGKAGKEAPRFAGDMAYEPIPLFANLKRKTKKGFYRVLKRIGVIKREPLI
jgi:hypothetical protein